MDNVKSIAAAGEKAKALQAALAQIEKQFGKGTIMRLGEGGLQCFGLFACCGDTFHVVHGNLL